MRAVRREAAKLREDFAGGDSTEQDIEKNKKSSQTKRKATGTQSGRVLICASANIIV